MSSPRFEAFLARLYADRVFLERFLSDPVSAMSAAGLDLREQRAAASIDRASLLLAAHSYARKRAARGWRGPPRSRLRERLTEATRTMLALAMSRARGWIKRRVSGFPGGRAH